MKKSTADAYLLRQLFATRANAIMQVRAGAKQPNRETRRKLAVLERRAAARGLLKDPAK